MREISNNIECCVAIRRVSQAYAQSAHRQITKNDEATNHHSPTSAAAAAVSTDAISVAAAATDAATAAANTANSLNIANRIYTYMCTVCVMAWYCV